MRRLSIIISVLMISACIKDDHHGADLKIGDVIPDFTVVMNDGSVVTDDDLRENVSVVMFFHTSCPDCQQTLPIVQEIYDKYAQKGVRFALISRYEGSEEIESYWAEHSFNMPYSAQKDRKVYNKFASSRIPRVYICDKDGIIRYIFTDDPIPTYDDLMYSLESLIR